MQQRSLGRSGLSVSLVGLGCNNFGRRIDAEASRKVVHKALDLGITLFDTADVYRSQIGGSEEFLGQALGARRKDIVLATKVGMQMDAAGQARGASRRHIVQAVEASLRRLNTDWIDLYQQHQPDPLTPIEETLRAFDDLLRQGKVRYLGCSNLKAWQVVEARWTKPDAGPGTFRVIPGRIQPAVARTGARPDPDARRLRDGAAAVLPAGERTAERQIPAQHADAGGGAAGRARGALWRSVHQRRELGRGGAVGSVLPRAGAKHAGVGIRVAGGAARCEQRDRRCNAAGTSRPECARRGVGADGRRDARRGCNHAPVKRINASAVRNTAPDSVTCQTVLRARPCYVPDRLTCAGA